jgi:hypothetical protein
MHLRTYPLDAAGPWRRRDGGTEDLIVACSSCGHQPAGQVEGCGEQFRFMPFVRGDGGESFPATEAV